MAATANKLPTTIATFLKAELREGEAAVKDGLPETFLPNVWPDGFGLIAEDAGGVILVGGTTGGGVVEAAVFFLMVAEAGGGVELGLVEGEALGGTGGGVALGGGAAGALTVIVPLPFWQKVLGHVPLKVTLAVIALVVTEPPLGTIKLPCPKPCISQPPA